MTVQLGILADIHGDWLGFLRALQLFEHKGVSHILCAGDIVDRGAGADRIVEILRKLPVTAVQGNHEQTVLRGLARRRASPRAAQLAEVGRVIKDETRDYIAALPPIAQQTIAGVRILLAHGTPWSDVVELFPDSRQAKFDQLVQRYGPSTDVIVLGHTHKPMHVCIGSLHIVNPGSIYGVTVRDSHTCGVLTLPSYDFRIFDLVNSTECEVPVVQREVSA